MMSEPLPSGWHSAAPSEARRSIPSSPPTSSAPLPVFLVPSLPLPSPSPPSPPLPLSLALSLVFSRSPPSERAAGVAHRNKSKHHHGVVTGPRSHGGWISGPFLRSPGIITGPPWGFTRPEVRHQRDTCSTLTIIAPLSLSLPPLLCSLPIFCLPTRSMFRSIRVLIKDLIEQLQNSFEICLINNFSYERFH